MICPPFKMESLPVCRDVSDPQDHIALSVGDDSEDDFDFDAHDAMQFAENVNYSTM